MKVKDFWSFNVSVVMRWRLIHCFDYAVLCFGCDSLLFNYCFIEWFFVKLNIAIQKRDKNPVSGNLFFNYFYCIRTELCLIVFIRIKFVNCIRCHVELSQMIWFYSSVLSDTKLRAKWITQIERHQEFDSMLVSYTVYADHFDENDIQTSGNRKILKKGSLPRYFPE